MEPQVQADICRRAELFTLIVDLIRANDDPAVLVSPRHGPPRLSVLDRRIFVNGFGLDLSRRPLMLRLFQAFTSSPDGWMTRDDLLRRVYRVRPEQHSERYVDSVMANAVKLVSRSRAVTAKFLATCAGPEYEWLAYDSDRRAWQLVRRRK